MLTRIFALAAAVTWLSAFSAHAVGSPEKTQKWIAVLQSNAAFFDKARACQQLGEIGSPEAIPALAALLADDHLGAYARSGLEGIATPEAAEALRQAAGTLKGNQLAGAVNSLGALRDEKALGLLSKLAADPASGVAREALLALGRISNAESTRILRSILAEGSEVLRPEAAAACLLAAEKQRIDGHAETASALYDAVRTAKVAATYQAAATRGAILAKKSYAFLVEQLRSETRIIRNAALLAIREIPSDNLANALNAELERATPELQLQMLTALADCHNAKSLELLQVKAASENAEVRKTALTVLGKIGGLPVVPALIKAIADNRNLEETSVALNGLAAIQGSTVDNLILKAMSAAENADTRVNLIRLTAGRGVTNASVELLRQSAHSNSTVSVAALGALSSLGNPSDLPALILLAKACKDEAVRNAAETAIASVCARSANADVEAQTVLAELKQATEIAEKNSWVRILASLGFAKALPNIQALMSDTNEIVSANAIEQLGRWPDPAPVEALLAMMESNSNARQNKHALRSVIQLVLVAAEESQRPDTVLIGWLERATKPAQAIDDKRLIISGLGRLKQMESVRLLAPYLEDPGLQAEAALAVIKIAPALVKQADSSALKDALEKIAGAAKNADIRNQAAKIVKTMAENKL